MSYTIAVLGLGAMGLPMATHLANFGKVNGFDIQEERLKLAEQAGINTFSSAKDAAESADVVLLAVRNGAQLHEALFGDNGVVPVMKEGSAVLLTSTVGIDDVKSVDKLLAEKKIFLVDSPVSGGPVRAGDGTLLVTVGANDDAWNAVHEVLEHMAGKLVRVGKEAGHGQAMKTVNQLLCGIHIAAAGEAMALAEKLGLDMSMCLDALMEGAAASWMLGDRGPRIIEALEGKEPEVKSRLDIFVKDMGIVTDAAKSVGLSTPVASAAEQLYIQGVSRKQESMDDSTVTLVISPKE